MAIENSQELQHTTFSAKFINLRSIKKLKQIEGAILDHGQKRSPFWAKKKRPDEPIP